MMEGRCSKVWNQPPCLQVDASRMNKSLQHSSDIDGRYCLPLNSPAPSLSLVGGKAKNLAKLVHL